MHTLNRLFLRFVALFACVWVASLTTGCGASYEIKARASGLPSRAQMDRLAVPADLLAKLNRILAESGKTAQNERPDPRYIAQSAGRYTSVEDRLVFALLQWGVDKYVEAKQPAKAPESAPVVAAKPLTLEDPRVQFAEGTVAGALVGAVPLGSVGADVAIELHILPNGTYWAQVGRACGEIGIGVAQIAVACTGVGAGIGMSGMGGGAAVGIVLISESLVIGYNGLLTTANGFRHAQQLAQEGPPSAPDVATPEMLQPPRKPATSAPVAAAPPPKPAAPAQVKPPIPEAPPPGTMLVETSKSGGTTKTVRKPPPGQKAPEITTEIHTHEESASTTVTVKGKPSSTKRPGNQGHDDHKADVKGGGREQAERLAKPGEEVKTEEPVRGHPGVTRRPDNQVVGTDGKTRVVVESERRPNGPYHQKRVKELEAAGIEVQTRPPSEWKK
ncbi:MAG TPA: hypothetical protein PK156_07340 [Polyangium sp.]|nr:hypothetical protein [Polyangium sp.]